MATAAVRLTQLSHGAGCACKLPAGSLREVLAALPTFEAADLLVGHDGLDDAAVWRVSDDLAVVQTIDFFTTTRTPSGGSRPRTRSPTSMRWARGPRSR